MKVLRRVVLETPEPAEQADTVNENVDPTALSEDSIQWWQPDPAL